MIILLIGLLTWTPGRSIDTVAIDDTLFIAMDRDGGEAYLFRYEPSGFIREASLGDYSNLSIGYFTGADTPSLIVVTGNLLTDYEDLIRRFDLEDLSLVWESDSLPVFEDWEDFMRLVFIERWSIEARQPRILSYYCTCVAKDSDHLAITSSSFDPDVYPGCYDPLKYYFSYNYMYEDDFFGPVTILGSVPLTVSANIWWGLWGYFIIHAQVHEADTPGWMRNIQVHFEDVYSTQDLPSGFCLGSCSSEAVFLWADSAGINWSTIFSGDPLELTGTYIYEYPLVGFSSMWGPAAAAASANPDDQGMLVCYYRDGYIRARYREDGSWSPFEHLISSSGWLFNWNLAVCSVTEGYWITWNDGGDYPHVAFINRDILTAITEEPLQILGSIYISASPNPFSSSVTVSASGFLSSPSDLQIFDLSGRLITEVAPAFNGNEAVYQWNGRTETGAELPDGIYSARLSSEESNTGIMLLKLE